MKNSLINLKSILLTIKKSQDIMTYDVKMASKKYDVISNHVSKNINLNEKLPNNLPTKYIRKRDKRIMK